MDTDDSHKEKSKTLVVDLYKGKDMFMSKDMDKLKKSRKLKMKVNVLGNNEDIEVAKVIVRVIEREFTAYAGLKTGVIYDGKTGECLSSSQQRLVVPY